MTKINIGIDVKVPKNDCKSAKCAFHGHIKTRGNVFTGVVISSKMRDTVIVEWPRRYFIPKYERYEIRRTKVNVHAPTCLEVKEGESVKIMGCRPISKTKNFIVIENLGSVRGFTEKMEAREESKVNQELKDSPEINLATDDTTVDKSLKNARKDVSKNASAKNLSKPAADTKTGSKVKSEQLEAGE